MVIPTNILCPACKTKSHPNRLKRELGNDELFCTDPKNGKQLHTFPNLEATENYNPELAYLEAESAPEEPEPPPTPKPEPAPRVEAPAVAKPALEEDPAAIRELDPVPVAAKAEPKTLDQLLKEEAKPEPPSLFNVPPPPKVVKFVPPPARKAPGGVLILTARIPDQYIGPFQVQAIEHLKMSIEEYFQQCVEQALQNAWWF